MLDGGDALFAKAGSKDPAVPRLILEAMAATGVAAAAVGELDLALGPDWLLAEAKKAGVPYLSANLRNEDGTSPFEGRRIVEIAGHRIGIFSVLQVSGRLPEGWVTTDPLEATKAEALALREAGVDLVIGLVHGPSGLVSQVARSGDVDLVVPAHSGATTRPYRVGDGWVTYTGSMGKTLLHLEIDLSGEGRLVSLGHLRRIEENRAHFESKLVLARNEAKAATSVARGAEIQSLIAEMEEELDKLDREQKQLGEATGRSFDGKLIELGGSVPADESFLRKVQALLP